MFMCYEKLFNIVISVVLYASWQSDYHANDDDSGDHECIPSAM